MAIIAIDFDGTIVEDKFPEIGELRPRAAHCIKALRDKGHQLILWTCRGTGEELIYKDKLKEAVEFCAKNSIFFDAINENVLGSPHVAEPKIYFDYVIDDKSVGGCIDWGMIEHVFTKQPMDCKGCTYSNESYNSFVCMECRKNG